MELAPKPKSKPPYVIWLIGVAAAIIILSKGIRILFPPPEVPLIPHTAGVQTLTVETAEGTIGRVLPVPTFTVDAALHTAARFTQASEYFPVGTMELVFAKDGHRTFELLELPITGAADVAKYAPGIAGENILVGRVSGRIYEPNIRFPACVDATATRPLAVCQFTKRFVFTRSNVTYVVAVDGNALSDGELIEVARSIPVRVD